MAIKFRDAGRGYEGQVWVGPTDRSHCERCDGGNKPIPTGIAVHFRDQETGHYVVVGRSCAEKKLLDDAVKISSLPVKPALHVDFAPVWLLLGWYEMREDFRLDRIRGLTVTKSVFRDEKGKWLQDFKEMGAASRDGREGSNLKTDTL